MSLAFSGSARVDHGAQGDLNAATIILWLRPTQTNFNRAFDKTNPLLYGNAAGRITLEHARATQSLLAVGVPANFAAWGVNKWVCLVGTYNVAATDTEQRILVGDATTPAAEPSSYFSQRSGSGTPTDSSTVAWFVGNAQALNSAFAGRIALIGVWNRQLSTEEIHAQQYRPHPSSGCVLLSDYLATGTVNDRSTTNADGTVTSATLGTDHAPYRFSWRRGSRQDAVAASAGDVHALNLLDSFSFSDTVVGDDVVNRDFEEGSSGTGTFSDQLISSVIQGSGGNVTISVNLTDSFALSESFGRNPTHARTLSG